MKKKLIIVLFLLFCLTQSYILFSQPLDSIQTTSGISTASFGTFTSTYDNFLSILFWQKSYAENFSLYTGINDNTLNIAFATNFTESLYTAFLFQEKITNYKWWPQNMTNESWTVLVAWKNLMAKAGYYDYCISEGVGTALPYLFLGNKWKLQDWKLKWAVGFDVAMQFASGNKMDVFQPKAHFLLAIEKSKDQEILLKYRIMGTYASAHNVTDVANTPLFHDIYLNYKKNIELLPNLTFGINPFFSARFNSIPPTEQLIDFLPIQNEYDLYLAVPLALKIIPKGQKTFTFVTSLKIDIYYASYDHLGNEGLGGNNYSGWVPGIGIGLGGILNFSDKCFLDFGINYTAIPEVTSDLNEHAYNLKNISLESLFQSPLTLSLQINF